MCRYIHVRCSTAVRRPTGSSLKDGVGGASQPLLDRKSYPTILLESDVNIPQSISPSGFAFRAFYWTLRLSSRVGCWVGRGGYRVPFRKMRCTLLHVACVRTAARKGKNVSFQSACVQSIYISGRGKLCFCDTCGVFFVQSSGHERGGAPD